MTCTILLQKPNLLIFKITISSRFIYVKAFSHSVCLIVFKAHEVLCLEMLTLLLERPTDDSVEVAIGFLKECGLKLTQVSPRGINGKNVSLV